VGIGPGKVRVQGDALATQLAELPEVTAVHPLAPLDDVHRFEVHAARDVRADLFRWAVDRGHVLVELAPVTRDLEEVFRSLTEAA
jgi:hypothetical protein